MRIIVYNHREIRFIVMTQPRLFMRKTLLILFIMLMGGFAFSADFNEKQKAIIYNEAIKILKNYEQYSNQMADAVVNVDELNKLSQKLIDQFVSRKAIIYNDLDPTHKLSEAYELETYVANILLWYPDGMKINLDFQNLKAGNIISHGNDIYTVDILTSKRINGNYLNKQTNSNTELLLYRIAFFQKGGNFESYKIAGVRSSKATTIADDTKILAEVKSVEFSEKDMALIKEQTKALLNDYINFINLITDPKETSEDKVYYRYSFLGLFKDSTLKVANDIEPNPTNRWLSVTDYQNKLTTSYPEGIRNVGVNVDSAQYGKVIPEGNEHYYINGYIDKYFSGKYVDKTVFRDNSTYDFKVSFEKDENTFKNFRLASIDKFGLNLYSQTVNAQQELPQQSITSLQRSGLFIGLSVGGGVTSYDNPNLSSNPILSWSTTGKVAFDVAADATLYLTNRVGIRSGIGYARYSANTSLNGNFRNTEYFTDVNGDSYLKDVAAAYDSLLTFSYISIPLTVVIHSNSDPEKWGFYGEVGLLASFNVGATYHSTGSLSTSGYYEQNPIGMQIVSAPEFGFSTRTNIDSKGDVKSSSIHLAVKASFGVTYPINYFTTVYAGPEMVMGISNISKDSKATNAFGTTSDAKKVGISKYGVKFGITYKF